MKFSHLCVLLLGLSTGLPSAFAHISYTNRNFNTIALNPLVIGSPVPSTITGQTVSSSFGWADATDADWGDTHRTRVFRFTLDATATVTISASRTALGTGTPGIFLPAFSVFSGLSHTSSPLAHDSSALSQKWLTDTFGTSAGTGLGGSGKEGSLNALGNWSVGNSVSETVIADTDSLRSFVYLGHASDDNSDGLVSATFTDLAAGDYSLFVGGNNYDAQTIELGPTFPTYGIEVSVQAIPEPGTIAMFGVGVLALLGFKVLKRRAIR